MLSYRTVFYEVCSNFAELNAAIPDKLLKIRIDYCFYDRLHPIHFSVAD